MILKIILRSTFAIFPLFSQSLPAENCTSKPIALYYANGMFNSKNAALRAVANLEKLARHPVKLAYNLNEDALTELIQVMEQKNEEYARLFWQELAGTLLTVDESSPEVLNDFLNPLHTKMIQLANSYDKARYLKDADLRNHVKDYESEIQQGRTVSVVAHSQGNFYANSAGQLLGEAAAKSYFVMAVATPAAYVFGDGPYLTLDQDKVIAAVRALRGALPANRTVSESDGLGHDFVNDYLRGSSEIFDHELQSIMRDERSDSMYEPSFVDESLHKFWRYAINTLTDVPRKFEPRECLAILSFAKLYKFTSESCEKRSLHNLLKIIDSCRKKDWKTRRDYVGFASADCSLETIDEVMEEPGPLATAIEEEHEECFDAMHGSVNNLIEPNVDAAIELLEHPPARQTNVKAF